MNDDLIKPGSIVPKAAAPLRTLTAVMAVMCFLAVIAVGAMLLINRAVAQWSEGLASEATVQLPQLPRITLCWSMEIVCRRLISLQVSAHLQSRGGSLRVIV